MCVKYSKVYLQPRSYLINTILDVQEIQHGKGTFSESQKGIINFSVRLYHAKWDYQFVVTDIGMNRCTVEIGIGGDVQNKEAKILREFALLDSMLTSNTQIEMIDADNEQSAPQAVQTDMELKKKTVNRRERKLTQLFAACMAFIIIGVIALYIANRPFGIIFEDEPVPLAGLSSIQIDTHAKPYAGTEPNGLTGVEYRILGFTKAAIPADTTEVSMFLLNPEDNPYNFAFRIILADDETLYASGLIEPGWYIEDISLEKSLPEGEHDATLEILVFEPDSFKSTHSTAMDFTLIVESQ
jgi:hypothetical protein